MSDTPKNQAERIYARFGGAMHLVKALAACGRRRNAASVYRWNLPRPGGTGGTIPTSAIEDVKFAARFEGIVLTAADLFGAEP